MTRTTIMCIPRIDTTIPSQYIQSCFENKNIGHIERIIELPHKNNPTQKRIILHVTLQETSENAKIIKERFSQKQDVKLVHNFPWFWKIVEANNIISDRNISISGDKKLKRNM
jgi:hypothetical protein